MSTITTPKPTILCVDDEPQVLEALQDGLRRCFRVVTKTNGFEALRVLATEPVAVVVSDMRMPRLDGAQFLSLARERSPDTVRMLLTGQSNLDDAVAAVNDGQIFRFLVKPCPVETLVSALEAGVEQHRLVTAERELLQETLRGAVSAMMEVLTLAAPDVFGRANRVRRHVNDLARAAGIEDAWEIETAALLSQIGFVTVPADLSARLVRGIPLNPDDQAVVDRLPDVSQRLIASIPRLEPVQAILRHQTAGDHAGGGAPVGARILRIASDFDMLESQDIAYEVAIGTMRAREHRYDAELLDRFAELLGGDPGGELAELAIADLRLGMRFAEDVVTVTGATLIARGSTVTRGLLERIQALAAGHAREPVRVWVPDEDLL